MIDKFKHIFKQSFVYSLFNVANKIAGIILIPLYTEYLTTEQYGILGIAVITTQILSQALAFGQGQSLIRLRNDKEYSGDFPRAIFNLLLLVLIIISLFSVITWLIDYYTSGFGNIFPENRELILLLIPLVSFTILNNLLLSKLRAEEKSVKFTFVNLLKLILIIGISVYLLVFKGGGVEEILYAQIAGELIITILLLPGILMELKPSPDLSLLKVSLLFGLPLVGSTLASNLLNGSDRFLIVYMMGKSAAGIYDLGYRVAGLINMFIIMPFNLTFVPFSFRIYNEPEGKKFFAEIMTVFTLFLSFTAMIVGIYAPEIVHLIASKENYYVASSIVPLVVYSYIFVGMNIVALSGMLLTGNTKGIAVVTFFAAAFNIGLNFPLINYLGINGAALSTIISFILLYFLTLRYSNKYYRIKYEHRSLFIIIISSGMLCFLFYYFLPELNFINILLKLLSAPLFAGLMIFTGVVPPEKIKKTLLILIRSRKK